MRIADFLEPECTLVEVPVQSKKRLFESIASFAVDIHPETDAADIFDHLFERERLGSTGIGHGVAIPHCRIENCPKAVGLLMRLETPIDFDAADGQPVDLVFTLLVPKDSITEHLEILQVIAEHFSLPEYRAKLRAAPDSQSLYRAATAD